MRKILVNYTWNVFIRIVKQKENIKNGQLEKCNYEDGKREGDYKQQYL